MQIQEKRKLTLAHAPCDNKLLAKVIIFIIYILNFVLACSCIKVQSLTWPKQPQTCPVFRDFCKTILFKTQGMFGPFLNESRLAKKSGHDVMDVEGHIKMIKEANQDSIQTT